MAIQIQYRRDLAATWTSVNPVLAEGEPGYETDTGKFKVGNGTNTWSALSYSSGPAGATGATGAAGAGVPTGGTTGQVLAKNSATNYDTVWATAGAGTVTSVDMSVPTGLSVSGNPVTSSGTLAVTYATGYSIPTTANQTNWSTAYGWGNHASAGYLTSINGTQVTTALGYTPYDAANPAGYTTNTGTVTSVTGTSPVVSSGGNTPAISMAAANTTTDGYLTSTDWNTFNGKGSGTVTSASIVSANGFAGTVATATSTPAITLTTSITGILKGNATAISAATSGTDYAPGTSANTSGLVYSTTTTGALTTATGAQISTALGSTAITGNAANVTGIVLGANGGTGIANTGKTITIAGNLTHAGAFTQTFTATGNTSVTLPTTGTLATLAGTETLTNKRINLRVQSQTSTATLVIDSDSYDQSVLTAQAASLAISAPTGTPVNGQKLTIRIKDSGSAQTISWTTTSGGFRIIGVTLPTTTVASKVVYIGAVYNSDETFWDVVSVAQQA